jgi:hypothetical protein
MGQGTHRPAIGNDAAEFDGERGFRVFAAGGRTMFLPIETLRRAIGARAFRRALAHRPSADDSIYLPFIAAARSLAPRGDTSESK